MISADFDDSGDWDNRNWSFGGIFSWNLFDGGRVRGRIDVEDARTEQLLQNYEQTVLDALNEVETSMSNFA